MTTQNPTVLFLPVSIFCLSCFFAGCINRNDDEEYPQWDSEFDSATSDTMNNEPVDTDSSASLDTHSEPVDSEDAQNSDNNHSDETDSADEDTSHADSEEGDTESSSDGEPLAATDSEELSVVDTDTVGIADTETEIPVDTTPPCEGCMIDGTCYGAEAPNPQNLCEICLPDIQVNGWTANEGASCDDGQFCNGIATCSADGVCVAGTPVSCELKAPCASAVCDEFTDSCKITVDSGKCLIHGACYSAGEKTAADGCQQCVPSLSNTDWSPTPAGTSCGYCLMCDGEGSCGRQPSCCHVQDSPVWDGYCATAPELLEKSGCGIKREWYRNSNGSEAEGSSAYLCNEGEWVKDPEFTSAIGRVDSNATLDIFMEQWFTYSCSFEISTELYQCSEDKEW